MNPDRYIIKWQRWQDAFSSIFQKYQKDKKKYEDDFEKSDFSDLHEYSGPVAQTPHGLFPINESNLPSTVFNLWRADTNFVITRNVDIIINNELGVEAYDQITPYRFRISIGKLFDEQDVQERLTKSITAYKMGQDAKIARAIENSQGPTYFSLLHKQFSHFVVLLDGSKKVVLHGKSDAEVQEKLAAHLKTSPNSKVQYLSNGKGA